MKNETQRTMLWVDPFHGGAVFVGGQGPPGWGIDRSTVITYTLYNGSAPAIPKLPVEIKMNVDYRGNITTVSP